MQKSEQIRKLQVTIFIKHECKRLDYRIPSDRVLQSWGIEYALYVLNCLKSVGVMASHDTLRSQWVEYNRRG